MSDFITKVKTFLYDLRDVALLILSGLAAIFAALFFIEKKKNEVQKELTQNAETIQKVDKIDTQISDIKLKEKEKEDAPVTKGDLLKFLNDSNKPK
jgi:hypothetical protein